MAFMLDSFNQRVSRCGVELELLSSDDRYNSYGDGGDYFAGDDEVDEYGYALDECGDRDESDDVCQCEDCRHDRLARRRNRSGRTSNVGRMLTCFHDYGLTDFRSLHSYHCDCDECDYERGDSGAFFAAQEDCTVGMEFVSRILSVHDRNDMHDLGTVPDALERGYSETAWRPDGYRNNGNHIHVGLDGSGTGVRFRRTTLSSARDWLLALSAEVDLGPIADGGCGQIRGYNGDGARKTSVDGDGYQYAGERRGSNWFSRRESTMEFRLFNTPAIAAHVPMHVSASVAMLRWSLTMAIRYRDVNSSLGRDRHLESTRRDRIGRNIADCLPATPWRDETADLITSAFNG